ncbi:hypothetical protein BC834DRAFT_676237 [Gloeopeniophorella convolvens]|nr:hypothetical protein BC834DRAFT_676237 [Gloeopeniophorella convolvens]
MKRNTIPDQWRQHIHVNGTLYYSLEAGLRDELPFRVVTTEDVTNESIRKDIEDYSYDFCESLEEADIEEIPDDLELVMNFADPVTRIPVGSFMSRQQELRIAWCSRDTWARSGILAQLGDPDTSSTSSGVQLVVDSKLSFWLGSEEYTTHYTQSYPVTEAAFLTALAHSAVEHISGKGGALGRFNYGECRRIIEVFQELKACSREPDCEKAANAAILWHISRVMYEIEVHRRIRREKASKTRTNPFGQPSRVVESVLCCVLLGSHYVYRNRLERAHPLAHASLLDFRAFVQSILLEWSDANLLATVFVAANIGFLQMLPGITAFQRTACLASTLLSLLGIVTGLHHTWGHRIRANADYEDEHNYFCNADGWTYSSTTLLAAVLAIPIASLLWAVLCFIVAMSAYCLQNVGIDNRVLLGVELGIFALIALLVVSYFSLPWKGCSVSFSRLLYNKNHVA